MHEHDTTLKHSITHHIVTKSPTVHARARLLAPDRLLVVKPEFDHMLELGIIEPNDSARASVVHLVRPKKAGGYI